MHTGMSQGMHCLHAQCFDMLVAPDDASVSTGQNRSSSGRPRIRLQICPLIFAFCTVHFIALYCLQRIQG